MYNKYSILYNNPLNKSKRLNIGFFTQASTSTGGFYDTVCNSMIKSVKKHNTTLYIYTESSIDTSQYNLFEKNLNINYKLAIKIILMELLLTV